jgi:tRNA threonylcarbamoyladenosine biosynthesis protein TsaE
LWISEMELIEFISSSPSDTIDLGEHIGRFTRAGDLFLLSGELGSGKTHFVKGIARGIDVPDWEYVVSPSFTLMNVYEGRFTLCHLDLYRLQDADTGEGLEIEEFLDTGIVAIEWAEKRAWWKGSIAVVIEFLDEDKRAIRMEVDDVSRAEIWRNFGC